MARAKKHRIYSEATEETPRLTLSNYALDHVPPVDISGSLNKLPITEGGLVGYFDGSTIHGNPGRSTWGCYISGLQDNEHYEFYDNGYISEYTTNNVTEWFGAYNLLVGLTTMDVLPRNISICGDSMIVINAINKDIRKNSLKLKAKDVAHFIPFRLSILNLIKYFKSCGCSINFMQIPREQNAEADRQANEAQKELFIK